MIQSLAVALALTVGMAGPTKAAPVSQPQIDSIASEFFSDLQEGKNVDAVHFIMKDLSNTLGTQAVETTTAQADGLLKSWGPAVDWQLVKSTSITSTFTRRIYYVRTKKVPYFVSLQFYSVDGDWRVIDFKVDTYSDAVSTGFFNDNPSE